VTEEILRGAVDCDVHVEPASLATLHDYFSPYWHDFFRGARMSLSSARMYPPNAPSSARPEARASGSFPPHTIDDLRAQLLDPYQPEAVILNCIAPFVAGKNPYYQDAVCHAVNEWIRDEWLDKDDRLRASIVVPTLHPEAAATEIDRLAADKRFVQVLLPVATETPWGNIRWQAIHQAAARNGLPIALHAWGAVGTAATATGYTRSYFEDYVLNSQHTAPEQVLSLVTEGVFDRHPDLQILLVECGFSWIPSLMWQFDKDWKSLWREVPWMKMRPSDYIRKHFRATTTPTHIPTDVPEQQVAQMATMLNASEFLLYSSDYPHDHGSDSLTALLNAVGETGREAILRGNAMEFYSLGDRAPSRT
jgi:predicted TIM-barrel fold metal-dependent hydrolase